MNVPSHRNLKRLGLIIAGLLGAAVITISAILVNAYYETRDPRGPRVCECALLKEWAASLPLTPQGHSLEPHNIEVNEYVGGFEFGGSGLETVTLDRQAFIEALTEVGINFRVDTDQPDTWIATFFPGSSPNQGGWELRISSVEARVGIRVSVSGIDASAWGLETTDDLWDFYQQDYRSALAAQEDRQRQAITTLRPIQQALQAMVQDG